MRSLRNIAKWAGAQRKNQPPLGWFKIFSIFFKILIKQNVKITGELDYKKHRIIMEVNSYVQLNRLNACQKEPETIRWIEENVRSGDVFYDVGANVGAYSFIAYAVTGGQSKIYAFEPSFATFNALNQNIFLNGFQETIIPLQVALGDKTELSPFGYFSILPGATKQTIKKEQAQNSQPSQAVFSQAVLSFRLDDLISYFGIKPPNHIKIDVDGPELAVLRGAEDTLSSPSLETILVEVDTKLYPNNEIGGFLEKHGFALKAKYARGKKGSNYLFNCIFQKSSLG